MTCQDSFHEVAFNISFWTRNISSARILFWRGVIKIMKKKIDNENIFTYAYLKKLLNIIAVFFFQTMVKKKY